MKQQGADQIETLQRETAKLKKINAALMSRVERSIDQQFNAFSLFETAIALDHQVLNRTRQLQDALRPLSDPTTISTGPSSRPRPPVR